MANIKQLRTQEKAETHPWLMPHNAVKSISMLQPLAQLGGAKTAQGQPLTLRLSQGSAKLGVEPEDPLDQSPCT